MTQGVPLIGRVIANQAVTNSIVLVDATGITVPIKAQQYIAFWGYGIFTLGATGGFRFNWTFPATLDLLAIQMSMQDVTTPTPYSYSYQNTVPAPTDFTNAAAVASNYNFVFHGFAHNGATAGNLQLQFAQNNATANPITLLAGFPFFSWLTS